MHRKWKSVAALGMAVLLGCLMPMNTMLAAEEDTEAVQEMEMDSVSDIDEVSDDEAVSDDGERGDGEENSDAENTGDEEDADAENTDDENTGDEADAEDGNVDDAGNVEDEIVDEEPVTDMDGNVSMAVMSANEEPEAGGVEVYANTVAPVISIKWQGKSSCYGLGGKIDYKYVNNQDQAFECSVSQADSFSYSLEKVAGASDAKGEEQMDSLSWTEAGSLAERIPLSDNAKYVLYVKAVGADGKTTYARSGGIVVDTVKPAVSPLIEGKAYAEGTAFWVRDDNLESVKVNEKLVTPASDGSYRVSANGTSTSCVIRAKDKAGNETTCSITVAGKEMGKDDVISENGIYSLKPGVPYQLAAGKWKINGDSTVYQGGGTFYVITDGHYRFTKH
ncbi:MAG: hypothetical protein K2N37_03285 [Lachnospiraceae bacterium]|nr:hypothetical protein [Lachnospiraceae bacterium]